MTLAQVLGLRAPSPEPPPSTSPTSSGIWRARPAGPRPVGDRLLSLVPSTILDQPAAS